MCWFSNFHGSSGFDTSASLLPASKECIPAACALIAMRRKARLAWWQFGTNPVDRVSVDICWYLLISLIFQKCWGPQFRHVSTIPRKSMEIPYYGWNHQPGLHFVWLFQTESCKAACKASSSTAAGLLAKTSVKIHPKHPQTNRCPLPKMSKSPISSPCTVHYHPLPEFISGRSETFWDRDFSVRPATFTTPFCFKWQPWQRAQSTSRANVWGRHLLEALPSVVMIVGFLGNIMWKKTGIYHNQEIARIRKKNCENWVHPNIYILKKIYIYIPTFPDAP